MMAASALLLWSSSLLMIVLVQYFFQTSLANLYCTPSSCGIIRNISYPFRLKNDPTNCGDRRAELTCENNVTSIYLNSQKYYVKAINYGTDDNSTIRLVDAFINNHTCSFPTSSAYDYNFTYSYNYPHYRIPWNSSYPVNIMRCPRPLKNASLFTEITDCASNSSHARYSYIKVGRLKASDVTQTCGLDLIVMTSWEFKDLNNVSLSEIHESLLYGFELSFCGRCRSSLTAWDKFIDFFNTRLRSPFLILLVIVVLSGAAASPVMSIIGFTVVLGLLLSIGNQFYYAIRYAIQYKVRLVPVPLDIYTRAGGFDPLNTGFISSIMIIFVPRFIICPLLVWILIYKFRRRHLSRSNTIESFLQSDNKLTPIRYSYSDIKKMTRGFQDKLGEGGYGSVYKGKLRSGHHVAVKVLGKSGANGHDFTNEIATIGRIHHVNVVKLVGYCAQGSKRALVLDFMPNGSLEKYIFNREKINFLNWEIKFEIVVGVARGIEYLHRGCDIQILHFDIKPHNILLDDKFIPKISDFGLAKFCSTEKNSITLTAARGTIGYVAPELINRGIGPVSYKADVYSFGMLLMEMLGLKRDLRGNNDDSSKYFPCWVYDRFNQDKDVKIGNIDESDNNDGNDSTWKLVRKMTIVALWCIQMNPDDRPSMNKVLEMLECEVEHLQIPQYPSLSPHIVVNEDGSWGISSTDFDSVSLFHHNDAPSVEIKYY